MPTLGEPGYPHVMDDFRSFCLPGDTPGEIVQAFEDAARFDVAHDPFADVTIENTLHPIVFMDAEETEATIREIGAEIEILMAN